MLTLKSSYGAAERTIVVYEPGDVIPEGVNVVRYKDRLKALKGDYVTDINGIMMPCLRRQKTKHGVFFVFPRFAWFPYKDRDLIFPLYRLAEEPAYPGLPQTYYAIIRLVAKGEDLMTASLFVFKGIPLQVAWRKTLKMFRNDAFLEALMFQGGYMSTLAQKLEDKGINEEFLANEIASLIKSNDPKKQALKKWALETAMKQLDAKKGRRVPENTTRYDEDAELEKLIASPNHNLLLTQPPAEVVEVDTYESDPEEAQSSEQKDLHNE